MNANKINPPPKIKAQPTGFSIVELNPPPQFKRSLKNNPPSKIKRPFFILLYNSINKDSSQIKITPKYNGTTLINHAKKQIIDALIKETLIMITKWVNFNPHTTLNGLIEPLLEQTLYNDHSGFSKHHFILKENEKHYGSIKTPFQLVRAIQTTIKTLTSLPSILSINTLLAWEMIK
jgi:hypothetical protein